jgi:predicted SAM-dependent methyltransferase
MAGKSKPKKQKKNKPALSELIKFKVGKKKFEFLHPFRVDLACGQNKTEGFFGVDIAKVPKVDLVYDLEKYPWPFPDNSVDEAVCNHYIEHTKDIIKFMDEVHRILTPGAKIIIRAPYYNSVRAWQDPTHTRVISEATFLYYNKQWREQNKLTHYPIKSDFDFSYGYDFMPDWAMRSEEARAFATRHYTNVVADIQAVLVKKEPTK